MKVEGKPLGGGDLPKGRLCVAHDRRLGSHGDPIRARRMAQHGLVRKDLHEKVHRLARIGTQPYI